MNTEVTGHPGFPLAVEQSLTEQALTSDERAPPPQHDPTLPSAGVQPPLGDGSSARRLERPAPLTLALVLGCSMVVGGAGFAWRYSADSLVPRNAALMVEPLGARSTSSNDLPVPTLDQPPAYPEPLALGLADVEVVTQANETPFDGLVLTIPEKPANDRISPVVGHRTPSQRARHKRSRERESPARQRADPLHSVVVEAMLKDAQKAALSDPAYCFQLAAEAQAMRPSQQAAIVMIKCACRLGDADKANAAAKLLRGEHPKLKRLCELKGVELVMGGPRGRKPISEL